MRAPMKINPATVTFVTSSIYLDGLCWDIHGLFPFHTEILPYLYGNSYHKDEWIYNRNLMDMLIFIMGVSHKRVTGYNWRITVSNHDKTQQNTNQCRDVIEPLRDVKWHADLLFVQQLVPRNDKENIKAHYCPPLFGKPIGELWIPLTNDQWCRKVFNFHDIIILCAYFLDALYRASLCSLSHELYVRSQNIMSCGPEVKQGEQDIITMENWMIGCDWMLWMFGNTGVLCSWLGV